MRKKGGKNKALGKLMFRKLMKQSKLGIYSEKLQQERE